MIEIWKDIVGFEKIYQVSNLFNIKKISGLKQGILKPQINEDGYFRVGLTKNNKRRQYFVHQLVLEAFVGPKPFTNAVCRHLDGNSSSKDFSNLKWGTPYENSQDSIRHGTNLIKPRGSKNWNAKLNNDKIINIRKLGKEGELTHKEIAKIYNVTRSLISQIIKKKIWKHVK